MKYKNPIILSDYSDPDCIRVKDNYYMIASSFNHTPGVPVLKSKNLVDWKLIGYVFDKIPFERFSEVNHGEGAWAPSLRYHGGKYYALIPFPDEGIYVSSCTDIEKGDWSDLWCLVSGKGLEDPCPIWLDDKAYLVIGFAKSRAGINSVLAVYEVSTDLKNKLTDYKIVFDGHNTQPTIEGPKFYTRNGYIYILAPAGSVKTGWQTALRSKDIYGPYEEKIIMTQGDTNINGPHQGALIDLPNGEYAFIHFQDLHVYGRIEHLQPVKWVNDWPLPGRVNDDLLAGVPVYEHDYLIDKKSNYKIQYSDDFKGDKLSLMWQTPANKGANWYSLDNGLKLNAINYQNRPLNLCPNLFLTKIVAKSFNVSVDLSLGLNNDGDEAGLCFMGMEYAYISVKRIDGKNHLLINSGKFKEEDNIIYDEIIDLDSLKLNMYFKYPGVYSFGVNGKKYSYKFNAKPGRWIGGKYGIFARGLNNSDGFGLFKNFKVVIKNGKED